MFGLNQQGVNGYAKIGIETGVVAASPVRLIVMLYEGAITACHAASASIQKNEIERKSVLLSKAILIIESGLRLSLDKRAGGEIAESLDALYVYMSSRLAQANVRNQTEPVQEVIKLLAELKDAWETIDKKKAVAQMPNQAISFSQSAGNNHTLAYLAKV